MSTTISRYYYCTAAHVLSSVVESMTSVGQAIEWAIDDIAAIASMIRTGVQYVDDYQPIVDAIADAIETSAALGDAEALTPLAESVREADGSSDQLHAAIAALAQAVTIDSKLAGHSVASNYVTAIRDAI